MEQWARSGYTQGSRGRDSYARDNVDNNGKKRDPLRDPFEDIFSTGSGETLTRDRPRSGTSRDSEADTRRNSQEHNAPLRELDSDSVCSDQAPRVREFEDDRGGYGRRYSGEVGIGRVGRLSHGPGSCSQVIGSYVARVDRVMPGESGNIPTITVAMRTVRPTSISARTDVRNRSQCAQNLHRNLTSIKPCKLLSRRQ